MLFLPAVALLVAIMTMQLIAFKLALCISKLLLLVCFGHQWQVIPEADMQKFILTFLCNRWCWNHGEVVTSWWLQTVSCRGTDFTHQHLFPGVEYCMCWKSGKPFVSPGGAVRNHINCLKWCHLGQRRMGLTNTSLKNWVELYYWWCRHQVLIRKNKYELRLVTNANIFHKLKGIMLRDQKQKISPFHFDCRRWPCFQTRVIIQ